MNAKQLFATTALALIGAAAIAGEASPAPAQASTLTRAEVKAEFLRAQAAGELQFAGDSYGSAQVFGAAAHKPVLADVGRSREAVRDEARAVVRVPQYNPLNVGS